MRHRGSKVSDGRTILDAWIAARRIAVVPVDHTLAQIAADAFARYGKGRHPAGLNFGDCFAYALARSLNAPLLFKGDDFARTDVLAAASCPSNSFAPLAPNVLRAA